MSRENVLRSSWDIVVAFREVERRVDVVVLPDPGAPEICRIGWDIVDKTFRTFYLWRWSWNLTL